jgi:hypothetical protein
MFVVPASGSKGEPMSNKLPVWATTWQSLKAAGDFVARHPGLFGLLITMEFASAQGEDLVPAQADFSVAPLLWSAVLTVAVSVLSAPIFVAAYRAVLTDDAQARYDFRPPRTRLFAIVAGGWVLLFSAGALALISPMMLPDGPSWWSLFALLPLLVIVGIGVRLFLTFPLIAIDQQSPFRRSLAMTKGRWWRIFVTNFVIPLATLTVALIPAYFASTPSTTIASQLLKLLNAAIGAFFILAATCALGLTALWIMKRQVIGADGSSREAAAVISPSSHAAVPATEDS